MTVRRGLLGRPTRDTRPNRLRRVDRWLVGTQSARLRDAPDPVVVDLGFGGSPATTAELATRLAEIRADVRVVGLDVDQARVAAAQDYAEPGRLEFRRGGFELAGLRPVLVRAVDVLRRSDQTAVAAAWRQMSGGLADGGLIIEGNCDELGRVACWVTLDQTGPLTLTFALRTSSLERPGTLAERLPGALIRHNVPGQPVHALLATLDAAWQVAAPYAALGPRQRWAATVQRLVDDGWPVVGGRSRWRLGELTVRWSAVAAPSP